MMIMATQYLAITYKISQEMFVDLKKEEINVLQSHVKILSDHLAMRNAKGIYLVVTKQSQPNVEQQKLEHVTLIKYLQLMISKI